MAGPRFLDRLRRSAPPLPRPETPICLIGDPHGRHDLLCDLLDAIARRASGRAISTVVLGDMIDRGPDSARVLADLACRTAARGAETTCLMGNHERMLLDFLAMPEANRAWLRHGGAETLRSFGIDPERPPARLATDLRRAMPAGTVEWIAALPRLWQSDGLAAVHAGADPRLPLSHQMEDVLLWGHGDFGRKMRRDRIWVVHGHVVSPEAPWIRRGTIGADTGAWSHGVLSAVWLDADGLDTVTARES